MRMRFSVALLLTAATISVAAADAEPSASPRLALTATTRPAAPSDFNGDGVTDLAIAVPWDSPSSTADTGGVHIVYGNNGVDPKLPNKYLGVDTPGIAPLLKQYPTLFGHRIASADFNRDGYADLAIAVPGFDEPDVAAQRINVGGVVVVYGSADGLEPRGTNPAEVWSQDSPGVQGVSEDDDDFGSALAAGDFDGDGFADLAIGADGETSGPGCKHSGQFTVLYGGRGGLTGRDQVVDQDSPGILDHDEAGDWASATLVSGDFDGDGVDDLAMGVAGEGVDGYSNAGAVNVIYGTKGVGLTGQGDRFVNQASSLVPGAPRRGDGFGAALTAGDFNGDQLDDLVVGAPEEDAAGSAEAGTVTVIDGSDTGLSLATSRRYTLAGLDPMADPQNSHFGAALATGDVNGDGLDELAVGSPTYDWRHGRVDVLTGGPDGLTAAGTTLDSTTFDAPDLVRNDTVFGETFGAALQFGAFDAVPGDDLAVGVPRATLRTDTKRQGQAGAVAVAPSRDGVLAPAAGRWIDKSSGGMAGDPQEWAMLGFALDGSGDYTG